MLIKIISGFQTGSDFGGILASTDKGVPTGGTMPAGFRTLIGKKPEYAKLYGATEHTSWSYVPRTYQNAKDGDGTIRIAKNFDSSGEKCTLKAINQYSKPYFDVLVRDTSVFTTPELQTPALAAKWIIDNSINILNVAGNAEGAAPGIEVFARRYISALIDEVRKLQP